MEKNAPGDLFPLTKFGHGVIANLPISLSPEAER
jgi:hypothetical protein